MEENFNLPEAVLARCPTCLANFRKNFCDLTCRPDQSRFVNASKTVKATDFKGKNERLINNILNVSSVSDHPNSENVNRRNFFLTHQQTSFL